MCSNGTCSRPAPIGYKTCARCRQVMREYRKRKQVHKEETEFVPSWDGPVFSFGRAMYFLEVAEKTAMIRNGSRKVSRTSP